MERNESAIFLLPDNRTSFETVFASVIDYEFLNRFENDIEKSLIDTCVMFILFDQYGSFITLGWIE